MIRNSALVIALISVFWSAPVSAQLYSTSRTSDLVGHFVLAIGKVSELRCMQGGRYDCNTWPRSFFRIDDQCFEANGAIVTYNTKGILADKDGVASLFIERPFSVSGNYEFQRYRAEMYECPTM